MHKQIINSAQRYLESKKLDAFEIFFLERDHLLADAKLGEIESLEEATETGIAIRVLEEGRLGFSFTTSLTEKSVKDSIESAVTAARETDPDDAWAFAEAKPVTGFDWECYDETLKEESFAKKAEVAIQLEAGVLKADNKIKRVRKSIYEESAVKIRIVNSEGVDLAFEKTLVGCELIAVAESGGDSQWAMDLDFSHARGGLDAARVIKDVAERAVSLLGAGPIPTTRTPACLHPFAAAGLLKEFSAAFFANNIYKKKSPLEGKLNKPLYSGILNIMDNGLLERGFGSTPFDGEGLPSKKTYLVQKGVVRSWLADIYWGRKLAFPSTGSSRRDSLKETPSVGISNLYIEPGNTPPERLMAEMDTGFYITGLIGVHTANPITGDFSVGAEGLWLEKGRVIHPVKGVVVAGNFHDVFKNLISVASDLRFMGRVGSPTLLVSEIQVSGS